MSGKGTLEMKKEKGEKRSRDLEMAGHGVFMSILILNLETESIVIVNCPVAIPDLLRYRAYLAISDWIAVEACDGHDTTGSGAHENLISVVRKLNRYKFDADFQTVHACDINNALASDALEDAALGSI
jgi:hypothetical protein